MLNKFVLGIAIICLVLGCFNAIKYMDIGHIINLIAAIIDYVAGSVVIVAHIFGKIKY